MKILWNGKEIPVWHGHWETQKSISKELAKIGNYEIRRMKDFPYSVFAVKKG